jgi:hypothetical protein
VLNATKWFGMLQWYHSTDEASMKTEGCEGGEGVYREGVKEVQERVFTILHSLYGLVAAADSSFHSAQYRPMSRASSRN